KMLSSINKGVAYAVATIAGFLGTICFLASGQAWAIVLILLGPWLAILIHELGHTFAAWRLGMNVRAIAVGPIELRLAPLHFRQADNLLGQDVGGHVRFDETSRRYLTRKIDALITAAGPAANLLTTIVCAALAFIAADTPAGRIAMGFAYTSLATFILSAWPFKLASGRGNDALELVRMFRREPARRSSKRSPWQAR
ncbi:MAG TPA: site-2 protease family protein, partial [Verrucomicrobiae bacterium]|nr:site-2 protease family protein [Verrucomicrobiae bacterium]